MRTNIAYYYDRIDIKLNALQSIQDENYDNLNLQQNGNQSFYHHDEEIRNLTASLENKNENLQQEHDIINNTN
jgi:hypothetical protein